MAKQYYIKKDPSLDGPNVEWVAVNGKEFYRLITSPAGKGRYFIDMEDFMIEANEPEYINWRKEKDHRSYLQKQESKIHLLSLDSDMPTEDGNGEEMIPDEVMDMEELVINAIVRKALLTALNTLDAESYHLIDSLILSESRKSERDLAVRLGLSQNAIHKRKKKILENLKLLVVKAEKSSQ